MIGSCATLQGERSSMTFAEFWPVYVRAHSRPATRVAHLVGTLGGWMLVGAAIAERRWWWLAAAILLAYWLAWVAPFFLEPNMPAPIPPPFVYVWSFLPHVFLSFSFLLVREQLHH